MLLFWAFTMVLAEPQPGVVDFEVPDMSAVCIMDNKSKDIIYEENGFTALIPASTLKVLSASTVLDSLGRDYHFKTEIYSSSEPKVLPDGRLAVPDIYIKGYGDPTMVSEEWQRLVSRLPAMEIAGDIVMDTSYFSDDLAIIQEPGILSPYNAINSAIAANYNTIAFKVTKDGVEPEEATPLVPYVNFRLESWRRRTYYVDLQPVGDHLLIIAKGRWRETPKKFRIHLGFEADRAVIYAGHIFKAFYESAHNVSLANKVRLGTVPPGSYLLTTFYSQKNATEAVRCLLEYSNNFLANQLLLIAGAEHFGPPATKEKGVALIKEWLKVHDLADEVELYEASGLDPRNRLSACTMAKILTASFDGGSLAPVLLNYSPGYFYKTGTFPRNGVRNIAGYLCDGSSLNHHAAVFMCNGPTCTGDTHQAYKNDGSSWATFLYGDAVDGAYLAPWPD